MPETNPFIEKVKEFFRGLDGKISDGESPTTGPPTEAETAENEKRHRLIAGGAAAVALTVCVAYVGGCFNGSGSSPRQANDRQFECPGAIPADQADGQPFCGILQLAESQGGIVTSDMTNAGLFSLTEKNDEKIAPFDVTVRNISTTTCHEPGSLISTPSKDIPIIAISSTLEGAERVPFRPIRLSDEQIKTLEAARNTWRTYVTMAPSAYATTATPWTKTQKQEIVRSIDDKFCDSPEENWGEVTIQPGRTIAKYDNPAFIEATDSHSANSAVAILGALAFLGVLGYAGYRKFFK